MNHYFFQYIEPSNPNISYQCKILAYDEETAWEALYIIYRKKKSLTESAWRLAAVRHFF